MCGGEGPEMDLATVAATLSGAIEAAKEIGSLTKGAKDHKLNERVLDLQERLIAVQGLVMELSAENDGLRRRVAELERAGEIAKEMVYEEPVYWRVHDGKRDGPFCRVCWETERRLLHTSKRRRDVYYCEKCSKEIAGPNAESLMAGGGPIGNPHWSDKFQP